MRYRIRPVKNYYQVQRHNSFVGWETVYTVGLENDSRIKGRLPLPPIQNQIEYAIKTLKAVKKADAKVKGVK